MSFDGSPGTLPVQRAALKAKTGQIARIYIRDTQGGPQRESGRYQRAFAGLPSHLWQVFADPAEIDFRQWKTRHRGGHALKDARHQLDHFRR